MERSETLKILDLLLSPDPNNWELAYYLLITTIRDSEKTEEELDSIFSIILALVLFNSQYTRNYGENRFFHKNLCNILQLRGGYYYQQYKKLDTHIPIIRNRYAKTPKQQYLKIVKMLLLDRFDVSVLIPILNHRLILLKNRTMYSEQWVITYLLMNNALSDAAQFCLKDFNNVCWEFYCFLPEELVQNSKQFNELIQQQEAIQLCNNDLDAIPQIIYQNQNLCSLFVHNNFVASLEDACLNWKKLEILSFYRCNRLRYFSPKLSCLTQLKHLQLQSCKLELIPSIVLELKQLSQLILSGNKLRCIPAEISQLKGLESLCLQDNIHLESIHPNIGALSNLKELILTVCNITELPPEICNLTQLKILKLNRTPLKVLPQNIGKLQNLEELNLSFTKITCDANFWESILAMKQLKSLQLSDVHIKEAVFLKHKDALSERFPTMQVLNNFHGILV